jgi:hypothetical protein
MDSEWASFVGDVDSALDGELEMEVLNKLWTLKHCTLYHVDHCNRVHMFLYVIRKSSLCPSCNTGQSPHSQCGGCEKVKVRHAKDYVPKKLFVKKDDHNKTCSGWISCSKALCLRQVRDYFTARNEPDKMNQLGTGFPPFVGATRDIFT